MINRLPLSMGNILFLVLVITGLSICSFYNFLLFHNLAELFSIVIAFSIFMLAWNTSHLQKNQYLLFLGIAYLFVGLLDLAHALTYKGMMIFPGNDPDTATQLWIIARYTESISLFIAPVFLNRKLRPVLTLSIYALITSALFWSIQLDYFPVCFDKNAGLTSFKITSEYIISTILVGALFMLYKNRERLGPKIYTLLAFSILMGIGSELAFTFYISVYGLSNILGHLLKFLSFYLIYKALVETGLKEPFTLLFHDVTNRERKYRSLFANMKNGFAYSDIILNKNNIPIDFTFVEINDAFEKITGLRRQEVIGKNVTKVIPDITKSNFDWIGELGKVAMGGSSLHTDQYSYVFRKWYSLSAYSLEKGSFAVVFEDITDRKMVEIYREQYLKQLNSLTHELERSNEDLQQFANIVSHDLLEPLRTVSSFVQLLRRRYQEKLDNKADKYINFIVDGTEHMAKLLNDMLSFARLGGGTLNLQPIELQSIVQAVLANMKKTIESKQAEIVYTDLPEIIADKTQMSQLFQNLISNALKFCDNSKPVIHISAKNQQHEWVICIKDNGIGIKEKDLKRTFLIFQRLHRREEYEGTGIGLALCKKIIERHGGRIWVESTPGTGSAFFFSIPKHIGGE